MMKDMGLAEYLHNLIRIKSRKAVDMHPPYLVLLLTTACNLDCVYCYRGEQREPQVMPRGLAEKALYFASVSGRPFHVQLTGGEPTLEPELVEWVASLIRKMRWPATVGLQTNGSLLDSALIKVFRQYEIQVGVSLDGPLEVQEEMRGKAAETFRGLKLLTDQEMAFRVTTVVTGQNIHAMDQLALLLGTFSTVRGLGLDLLVSRGRALDNDRVTHPSSQELKNGLKMLLHALNWINENRLHHVKLRELELLKRAVTRKRGASFCHAARGEAMAVLPDGSVYPCAQTAGDPCFACGTVDAPEALSLDQLGGYHLKNEWCRDCPLSGFCPGDCPSRQYYNETRDARLACVMYQTLWEECKRSLE